MLGRHSSYAMRRKRSEAGRRPGHSGDRAGARAGTAHRRRTCCRAGVSMTLHRGRASLRRS